jgi:hypothetical protein
MDGLSVLVQASAAAGDQPEARAPPPEAPPHPKLEAPRASVTPPLATAPVPDAAPAPAAVAAAAPAARNMAQPEAVAAAPPHAVAAPPAPTTAALMAAAAPPHAVAAPAPVTTAPPAAMDEAARKLAADHAAIREAYAREQAAAAPPPVPTAPLVQGVDDEWADWRGCVCGGSYYGEMVGCDGHCDNWFHFACVGLTRLPRGEWLCQDCKNKPKKKQKVEEPPPPPPPKKRENPAFSKHERKDREQLEALVERAKPLKFVGGRAPSDHTCSGAGFCSLDPQIFAPLQQLHANIVAALRRGKLLQSWEGKGKDVRERGFAFLPPTMIPVWDRARLEKGGLRFGAAQKEGQDFLNDEEANWKSSFHLFPRDVSSEARTALHQLIELVKVRVDDKNKDYVSLENLIALQPNLHNDAKHLPPHLDFPMHDGFGVVIVTIQMAGPQSVIALLKGADSDFDITTEKEKERCWTFSLNVGDCYILSGDARNVCDHGVLCVGGGRRSHKVDAARESLNLRFGLHTPAFADEEVYWQFPSFSSTLQAQAQAATAGEAPAAKGRRRRRR